MLRCVNNSNGLAVRKTRQARIAVERLEGRALMDAAASANVLLAAEAHVRLAHAQRIEVATTLSQVQAQLNAKAQQSLAVLHASQEKLAATITHESQQLQASIQAGASAA